jgi:4-amino-4-deoxychorismate lyase
VSKLFLETIKVVDGKIYNLPYHQKRYEKTLNSLGVSQVQDLASVLFPPQNGTLRCRVVYSSSDFSVSYIPYVKRKIRRLKIIHSDSIVYPYKYEDREAIEKLFAKKEECDEIIIVKDSLIKDTSIANIALYSEKEQRWFTPREPLLEGTTRARYIDNGLLFLKDIKVDELQEYSKLALLNAMIDFDIIAEENLRDIYC